MTDIETCYKAFRGEILCNITITSKGFSFEFEVTAKIVKLKCAVYEVLFSYYGRTYEEGKKIRFKNWVVAFWYILKYNLMNSLKYAYSESLNFSKKLENDLSLEPNKLVRFI